MCVRVGALVCVHNAKADNDQNIAVILYGWMVGDWQFQHAGVCFSDFAIRIWCSAVSHVWIRYDLWNKVL